jgi:hypothetical protein
MAVGYQMVFEMATTFAQDPVRHVRPVSQTQLKRMGALQTGRCNGLGSCYSSSNNKPGLSEALSMKELRNLMVLIGDDRRQIRLRFLRA